MPEWLEDRTADAHTSSEQTYDSYLISCDGIVLDRIPRADTDDGELRFGVSYHGSFE